MHSSSIPIFVLQICLTLSSSGAKNTLAKRKLRIVSQINLNLLHLWLAPLRDMDHFISYQKTTIWQETILWSCLMSGIDGSEKNNVYIVAAVINFSILPQLLI